MAVALVVAPEFLCALRAKAEGETNQNDNSNEFQESTQGRRLLNS